MKTRDLQLFKKFDNFTGPLLKSISASPGLIALLLGFRASWYVSRRLVRGITRGKQVENWRLIEGAADQQVVSWHWQPPKLVAGDNFSFRSFWGLKCNYQPQQMLTLMYIALMYYIAVKQVFFSESLSDQLTRMPNSSVCLSSLERCVSLTWQTPLIIIRSLSLSPAGQWWIWELWQNRWWWICDGE